MKQKACNLSRQTSICAAIGMGVFLAGCGGGGSSSSTASVVPTVPIDNQFVSSLSIRASTGATVAVASHQATLDDAQLAYSVIKQPNSLLQTGTFSFVPTSAGTATGTITAFYNTLTQQLESVVYRDAGGTIFVCSQAVASSNRCGSTKINYNVTTGAMQLEFAGQELRNNATTLSYRLTGQLSGSLETRPLQVSDLPKTSQINLSIDQVPVRVQSAQTNNTAEPVIGLLLEDGRQVYVELFKNDQDVLIADVGLIADNLGFILDIEQILAQSTLTINRNNDSSVAVSFNQTQLLAFGGETRTLSGDIALNKPVASLTLGGLNVEGATRPVVNYFSTIVNQFSLMNFVIQSSLDAETQTYIGVVRQANQILSISLDQVTNGNLTARYRCDNGAKLPCTGATLSADRTRIDLNNTPMVLEGAPRPVPLNGTLIGADR